MTEQAQTQAQQPDLGPELTITLHLAEINFVMGVLAKGPYEQVEGLISKIRNQAVVAVSALQQQEAPTQGELQ